MVLTSNMNSMTNSANWARIAVRSPVNSGNTRIQKQRSSPSVSRQRKMNATIRVEIMVPRNARTKKFR